MGDRDGCLVDRYLPPADGFVLESLVATTYNIDFEFLEEDLLPAALGVGAPVSRDRAFRSEVERRLRESAVTVLYDLYACDRPGRTSRRVDPIAIASRKLHSKISLLVWRKSAGEGVFERRVRVLVGSANLTRPGFRQNYEMVVALDFGGAAGQSPHLLREAIKMLRDIAVECMTPQLEAQLSEAESFAKLLGDDDLAGPALVDAETTLSTLASHWGAVQHTPPERVLIVSPFWPEGGDAAAPIRALFERVGRPKRLDLVCASRLQSDGKTLRPIMPAQLVADLSRDAGCEVYVRPAKPKYGTDVRLTDDAPTEDDGVDDTPNEDAPTRALHAKLVALFSAKGIVLYVGSSNFTRLGLAIAGNNWEAGVVYQLEPRHRKSVDGLLAFAAEPIEVRPGLPTEEPQPDPPRDVASFLSDVIATPDRLTVHFREAPPSDLVLLMPQEHGRYILLARAPILGETTELQIELAACPRVTEALESTGELDVRVAGTEIEARWNITKRARFAVRFDEKQLLPAVQGARAATELELIEYYRRGLEPFGGEGGERGEPTSDPAAGADDEPVDTTGILSYFVRSFIEAIPGIEAEVRGAVGSRVLLQSVLYGPTGVVTLVRRTVASLEPAPGSAELRKTPVAVGFQLVEIASILRRCRKLAKDSEELDAALQICREELASLTSRHDELRAVGFTAYRQSFLGRSQ